MVGLNLQWSARKTRWLLNFAIFIESYHYEENMCITTKLYRKKFTIKFYHHKLKKRWRRLYNKTYNRRKIEVILRGKYYIVITCMFTTNCRLRRKFVVRNCKLTNRLRWISLQFINDKCMSKSDVLGGKVFVVCYTNKLLY